MDLGVEGRACVVTGASRGIGAATARALGAAGARVLLVGRDREALDATAASCGAAATLAIDVTGAGAGEHVAAACAERLGPADVLVNGAGTSAVRALDELTDDDWLAQWELNVMAPLRLMRAVAPGMAERGPGGIVNVCSAAGKSPARSNAAYSVTKAAELALSRAYA